jgi:hypothetical protein
VGKGGGGGADDGPEAETGLWMLGVPVADLLSIADKGRGGAIVPNRREAYYRPNNVYLLTAHKTTMDSGLEGLVDLFKCNIFRFGWKVHVDISAPAQVPQLNAQLHL